MIEVDWDKVFDDKTQLNNQEVLKMANFKEEAQDYKPQHTMNIADLDVVSVDMELNEANDVEFPYKYIIVDDQKYRVPTSVIAELKAHLEDNPNLKKFRVKKTGEGMSTKYTVIPLI